MERSGNDIADFTGCGGGEDLAYFSTFSHIGSRDGIIK
jgi:hypothetical protein